MNCELARSFSSYPATGLTPKPPARRLFQVDRNAVIREPSTWMSSWVVWVGPLTGSANLAEVPRAQKRAPAATMAMYLEGAASRNEGIVAAYESGGFSMGEIAAHVGLHYSSVSKLIKAAADSQFKT